MAYFGWISIGLTLITFHAQRTSQDNWTSSAVFFIRLREPQERYGEFLKHV